MKIDVRNIRGGSYVVGDGNNSIPITFTCADIKKAIQEKQFDERSFQADNKSINEELHGLALEEAHKKSTKQHIERIAALSINDRWKQPILIYKDIDPKIEYLDGGHRVWAAKCLGEPEIEAIEVDIDPEFKRIENGKEAFWAEVNKHNGDFEEALKSLGIMYKR